MRPRVLLLFVLVTAGTLALPYLAHAAVLPFFGPIIGRTSEGIMIDQACPLGWGAVILVINNIIRLLLTLLIVAVAPIMIAYSGFLYVVNPVNPSGMAKAKGILLNTVVGLVVALAGWLIVAAIMAVLYHPNSDNGLAQDWSSIINSGGLGLCLDQKGMGGAGATTPPATPPPSVVVAPPLPGRAGKFTYTSETVAQAKDASSALNALLYCMSQKMTSDATITSISDSKITSGVATMASCAALGKAINCAHTKNSCHYGGPPNSICKGSSYAVDLQGNLNELSVVAKSCGASVLNEGNHLHASVGKQNGCDCDTGLGAAD